MKAEEARKLTESGIQNELIPAILEEIYGDIKEACLAHEYEIHEPFADLESIRHVDEELQRQLINRLEEDGFSFSGEKNQMTLSWK